MKLVALGSNLPSSLGSPAENVRKAVKLLAANDFKIIARGDLYETAPVPVSDQPNFINTVIQIDFSGTPERALEICLNVEREMGRVRGQRNEARIIDIDLIAWDNKVMSGNLILPHPRLHERAFVLYPLCDIAPEWVHPLMQRNAAELKVALPPAGIEEAIEQW
ncbi:MAG TPA: 2-amino-4-hydroxy-6-hydroxymethyldihydropteridine diphosphokinase [Alphaproteobacteria bacterium]|nr:2-amino-4-hydroxy-6-hydroxymethyldihydropteridine diphosphokinase [Rhodospirillaceae bacterium]HRJ13227.1 2-amino-4-hydroxy-6-hydroxymethyldihydropteridine diphosphokinase [Alphaproteobacteria bacterium]